MMVRCLAVAALSTALSVTPAVAQQGHSGQTSSQVWRQEQVSSQGSQLYLSTAAIRRVQQALNTKGYDSGNLTRQWDGQTREAARKYQKAAGLEPTGTPTIELINSLGMSSVLQGQGGGQQGARTAQGGQQGQAGGQFQWSRETAQGPGVPVYVSTAGVRLVQQALNRQGYDAGAVDGVWGQGTAKAAARYQTAKGLESNGKLDINLISALGLNQQILEAGQGGQSGGSQGSQSQQWSQEQARNKGVPLWIGPATVRQVQLSLNDTGFQAGAVDGGWGQHTSLAARRYQKSKGLEPTGTPTAELLGSLGINWMQGSQGGRVGQTGDGTGSGTGGQRQSRSGEFGQAGGVQGSPQQGQAGGPAQIGGQQQTRSGQGAQDSQQQARRLMTDLDRNADQQIDAMESLGNPDLSAEFSSVDRNRDGAIDEDELVGWSGLEDASGQT